MATIRVRAVPGRCYPVHGRPGEFVGYRRATSADTTIAHAIPGGSAYVYVGPVEVDNTVEIRRAISRGDLAIAADDDVVAGAEG